MIVELPKDEGHWIAGDRLLAIVVNLNAPDAIIVAELETTLKVARKLFAPMIERRGRYSTNKQFDERLFAKWRAHRIAELADLLIWRAMLDQQVRKYWTNSRIGLNLGFDDKQTSLALRALKSALKRLPALLILRTHPMSAAL